MVDVGGGGCGGGVGGAGGVGGIGGVCGVRVCGVVRGVCCVPASCGRTVLATGRL